MTASADVRISVVTPTHNRPDSLLRLLRALRDGSFPASDFEAVVVADGCNDDTVVRARKEPLPFRLTVIEQNPGRGAAAARNLGAARANGELIVFLDDDIEPSRDLLAEHWSIYAEATTPTVVVGPPLPVRDVDPGLHAIAAWGWWERQFEMMRQPGYRFTYEQVFSGNLAVPRALFAEVGGFDVEFNSCRDDSEFGLRAIRKGARVMFAPAAGAWHHELRNPSQLIRRKQAEGIADVRLARLYPDIWPSLRLSNPELPGRTPLGMTRRLAFDAPWLGRQLARMGQAILPVLEWARFRGSWRALQAGLMYFWYWHAAARAMGGRHGLAKLYSDHRTHLAATAAEQGPPFEINLAQGLEAAEKQLDARQPAHAAVLWGPHTVGYVYPEAGGEPLGGRHLRQILGGDLAYPLQTVIATQVATGSRPLRNAQDPPVSVIIPAYNAAATLGKALDSLVQQTSPNWEAIVVDDGSTDDTGAVAARYAARDNRIRVMRQANQGEGAARTAGLAQARHDWILFLDADDWMAPNALRAFTRATIQDDTLDAVHGGWCRVAEDGSLTDPEYCFYTGDLFQLFTRRCELIIHSALVRRSLALAVGAFQGSRTCADWDFWQRVARSGARFGSVPEVVAYYRMRAGSASTLATTLWTDGLGVIEQGHRADLRVKEPTHSTGAPVGQLAAARFEYACWVAGMMIAQNKDPSVILEDLRGERAPGLNVESVSQAILRIVPIANGRTLDAWDELWPTVIPRIETFLKEVECQSGAKLFATRTIRALERLTLDHSRLKRPCVRGGTLAFEWDIATPARASVPTVATERGHCALLLEGAALGMVTIPLSSDPAANAQAMAQAAAMQHTWPILRWFLRRAAGPVDEFALRREPDGIAVSRGKVQLVTGLTDAEAIDPAQLHDRVGWNLFLQELWGRPDLAPGDFYEAAPLQDAADADVQHVSDTRLTIEVSDKLAPLSIAPGIDSLEIDVRVAGAAVGIVTLPVESREVSIAELRTAITIQCAYELCRVAVREGVLGRARESGGSLRERLRLQRTAAADAIGPRVFPRLPNESQRSASVTYDRHHFESVFARSSDPWSYLTPYEQFKYEQTLALIQERRVPRALELACAEGRFTRQMAPHVDELLATDISTVALERARAECGDLPNVQFAQLDFVAEPIPGGFDLIVCSEVLYYLPTDAALLHCGAKLRDALNPGGRLVLAHTNVAADDPDEVGLVWDVPFGGKRIGQLLATLPDLNFKREVRTELYRIHVFERTAAADVITEAQARGEAEVVDHAPHVAPGPYLAARFRSLGKERERRAHRQPVNQRVPILMYHDVAPAPAAAAPVWRYRLSPNVFACQLEYLHDAGFRGATLTQWLAAMHYRRPLPERSVIFTFDDAYRSFTEHALPLLEQYGFPAIVFVPCSYVGGMNEWDKGIAHQVPVLDWDEIRSLASRGVDFGAHSMTHPYMTGLSNAEVLHEARQSKEKLERELRRPVTAFAYPYGDTDGIVQQIVAQCGYSVALTTRFERAGFHDQYMSLPRIEVSAHDDMQTFIANLDA